MTDAHCRLLIVRVDQLRANEAKNERAKAEASNDDARYGTFVVREVLPGHSQWHGVSQTIAYAERYRVHTREDQQRCLTQISWNERGGYRAKREKYQSNSHDPVQ